MDSFNVKRSCTRRWYIILPLLLLTVAYSYNFYGNVKPVFTGSSVIGISGPSFRVNQTAPGAEVPRNGLLDIGGATLVANLAALGMRDPAVVDRVVAAGGVPWYVSQTVPGNVQEMPLIMFQATAANPSTVTKTLDLLVAQSRVTLRTLQEQAVVPEDQMVTSFVVSPPGVPTEANPARVPATFKRFAAGVVLSIVLTVLVDLILTRRSMAQQRRHSLVEASAGPDPANSPEFHTTAR